FFFFSSRRRHTRSKRDWSSDVCSSDLPFAGYGGVGCDDGVDAAGCDAVRDRLNPGFVQIRRDLHRQRNASSVLPCQSLALCGERSEERRVGQEWRWGGGGWAWRKKQ